MSITRREFSQSLLAASLGVSGCAMPSGGSGQPAFESLDAIAQRKGMRVGNAIGISASGARGASRFHDTAYRELMARECSMIVAENETKWQWLQPAPGPLDFKMADEMFAWAKQRKMAIRGHTLIWQPEKWLPDWVNKYDFGANPRREAERLLTAHVRDVCRHFGRDVSSWDVVNEAVDDENGGALRRNVFTDHLGAVEQLELMFRLAREHAPHAELVYNDYMNWGDGRTAKHREGVLKLLEALLKRGAPVHALGLQAHIGFWNDRVITADWAAQQEQERDWRKFLDEVTGMGLKLLITEFDVQDSYASADIARRDAEVAAHARAFLDLTLSYPRLHSFVMWGMADHYSWLQDFQPRADSLPKRPTPYDAQLQPKPLRAAIAEALRAMPMRAPAQG